jgi:pyridoxal phosphate enzyme (YggS family)
MSTTAMSIADNIAAVRERVDAAARRAGRDPNSVALMAVSKTKPAHEIREAFEAGQRLFGENRVQEFEEKTAALQDLMSGGARFHLIGHLQSNKTNKAAELFHAVDSVDSHSLLERLNAAAQRAGKVLPVLVEINIGGEEQKSGLPADCSELNELLLGASKLPYVEIRGLMTVPPYSENPENTRPHFRKMLELRGSIAKRNLPGVTMAELSMGMSHDFEVAIEEGSTCVRVGTAIFGARNYR